MGRFQAPASARSRHIEFPEGSGRVAVYWTDELAILGRMAERARAARTGGDTDEAATIRREVLLIHELKVEFPGSTLRDVELVWERGGHGARTRLSAPA